ncbi:integrase [Paraburkholderia sp. HC6.4b]|uniref:tyrosine-type recombinase/integrase n=1 Tax=unclassified Paraburkholderia TaxID=2615204 RepID=UPI0016182D09|nr:MULTISPECIES: integrase family protein [unclassified Paraburkholderia]MBB5413764.1 integrase [Paraburkholderia sp. HC6.4b]MBB5456133.1 integrase [Paraburkholderia sp. Kb1A]
MAKVNFTAARVDGHSCPAGKSQSFIWDAKASGLGLRATASGAKSYIYQGKIHGGTVRVTIGDPKDWTIEKAQKEARRLQTLVDAGKDPREHAAEQRAAHEARKVDARRRSATVADAWCDYLQYLRTAISPKTKKPRSARYLADHEALAAPGGEPLKRGNGVTVRGPLAPLMGLNLSSLTAKTVAAWLADESRERPTNAAHAYRLLKAFIRWCGGQDEYAGTIATDAYDSPKVTAVLPQSKAKEGDCLQREQLPAWFAAVRQLGNPVISAYLQALLLTGARREEMAALKWADVDFQWRSLHVADKVETETGRLIPLTPYLASLLAALPRRNEWVFSSPAAADGKIAEPRIAHNQALAAAGLPHVTLHGLRRSFGTLSEWCEVPVGVVAQIMGHAASALAEKHYRRRPLDLLRKWHDNIEAWMLEQAGIDFMADVAAPGLRVISNR